ncbi:ParB/RepB/Spo0J family partition protein [Pseudoalteromonas sp. SSM20]|uniref:ParB/RepB/Spo0J family partition protein n=1 Tax=Pseudoalteromonas sp. SSM20 TaxID=3139394 RepID=UPI003BAC2DAF
MGLDAIEKSNISSLLKSNNNTGLGKPVELDISIVHDDPNNREDVTEEFLEELTADIKSRGVKSPVSVRPHPEIQGEYMLNFGHNRKAASIRAGKSKIPAFIDEEFEDYDQIKENLLKESLSARDLANFIQRKLNEGVKKGDIAKNIGKSASFVSQHVTLLKLPEPINEIYEQGRCSDVTVVNSLVKLYGNNPDEVSLWLEDETQDITRTSVNLLKDYIAAEAVHSDDVEEEVEQVETEEVQTPSKKDSTKDTDPSKLKKAIVQIEYQGQSARLLLNVRPTEEGFAFIKFDDDGTEEEVPLKDVQLKSVIEG